ncbi:chromosome segregation protein SMC [Candidatus Woesearchaeota archaeon]|nr:chromosome segregation protein SMC [Candidatus Woesearchaeota archaeon]
MIKSLTLKGFKSFAKKTDLIFGKGFNCIIGPNGSGKTNISDGICFVLGKSSAHEMRAEKSANLIFNGGKKGTPAKEAEVTIVFDNSSKKFPINEQEVKITRIVKNNGTSIYKINDETRTRQQVLDLMRSARLDPNGHNIVLQGDIVAMAEMKPIQRRELIDQIAGISTYEEKKQKCLNELQKVDGKLNEAEIILTEREANLRELKKERDQAIRYKELESELKDKKGTLLHLQIKDKKEKLDEIEKRKKESEDKIEKISKEIKEIKEKIQANKEEINQINNEVEVKGEKDQIILRKEIEELRTILVKANSRLEVCNNELEKIKTRKEQLKNNIKELNEKIIELNEKKQKQQLLVDDKIKEEKEIKEQIEKFKQKHGIDTNINKSLEDIDKSLDYILNELNKINEEKQSIIRQKDQIDFRLNSLDEKLQSIKGNKEDLEDLKKKKKNSKELEIKLSKSINEDSSYSLQLATLRGDITNNSEELARQKSRQIGIQEKSLGDLAIRKILEVKNQINGIHGTVSSLGTTESRYALALEIAAGSRINSIVVDSDITAKKCIEYLKSNRLGVATFLPLNKVKSRLIDPSIKELINKKGVQGLALDIVNYDKKYKDIFSYTLGSTIIVDDISIARTIGIGRARMVTLEGDLLEPSGAMIGGYRTQTKGIGFKEKEVDSAVSKLEQEIERQKRLIENLERKKVENEDIIRKLREEKANLDGEIIKLEKTLNIGEDTSSLLENKKNLELELKSEEQKLKIVESKKLELMKDLDDTKYKRQKIKEKLADPSIAKSLEKLEEEKLKIREKVLENEANIKNINAQITSMLAPEKDKTEKIIKQQDKESEDFSNEVKNIKELIITRENELKQKEELEKKIYSKFKDLINKRNNISEKIQGLESNIAREDEKLKAQEQKLNNINIDRAKAVAEVEALEKELEPFKECTIKRIPIEELKIQIKNDEKTLSNIGNVNLRALEVYEQIQKEYEKIVDKVSQLKLEKDEVLNMMAEIETKKKDIFLKTYKAISKKFKEIFGELTTKGEVHIDLENPENPLEGGIEIQVKVHGSKYLDIKSLSGGEKTMAALAFLFSIQEYEPSPFYLLDEVDAALDKKNSELLSKLIAKYTSRAQYVVISHNDNIITEAEYLYGVSMQENVSKIVSLKI